MDNLTILTNARAADQRSMIGYGEMLLAAARRGAMPVAELRGVSAFARLPVRGRAAKLARNLDRFALTPARAALHSAGIVHVVDPGNVVYLPFIRHRASVCTVHDMIPYLVRAGRLEGGSYTALGSRLMDAILRRLARVDRIVCVSHATRRDLLEFVDVDPARVEVVHNAVFQPMRRADAAACAAFRARHGLPPAAPLVLHVGRNFYKNRPMVLEVFARLRAERPDAFLVLVGEMEPSLRRQAAGLGLDRAMKVFGHVPRGEMATLYSAAAALLFPSLYEGFGLPVLEARLCGTPVVCSNRGALPEAAGEGALAFAPQDRDALVSGVMACLAGEAPAEAGAAVVSSDTWAARMLAVHAGLRAGGAARSAPALP